MTKGIQCDYCETFVRTETTVTTIDFGRVTMDDHTDGSFEKHLCRSCAQYVYQRIFNEAAPEEVPDP
jgi:hypothetical protein